ncbi:hypothetical protein RU86_GL001411 [Lactococcus piscium]|uniref:Uncharacterized protein n=1 Tax=Pseudolactococcus piscium TaxID=1364 RepID=A0A2A5RUN0_9LACT|nr:enhanced serine sensitivity protein SseB C-terminal domain-containing protein [Lactococcus piscium]PCS04679.1 hypothetical protein RU86_GL001411 [Lactococcus piscium]
MIEIAKEFSKNCEEISAVYLALMENNGSYSFLICIDGGNYEKLSKKFSEFIYENAPDKWILDNPVDFSEDMLQKYGEEYRIYQK